MKKQLFCKSIYCIGFLALGFAAGWWVALNRKDDCFSIQPESLLSRNLEIQLPGIAPVSFRSIFPLSSTSTVTPVRLSIPNGLKLHGRSRLSLNSGTPVLTAMDCLSSLGGADIVWTANEIVVRDLSFDEYTMEASKNILYLALCAADNHDLPLEGVISLAQDTQLLDQLYSWGVKDYKQSSADESMCVIKGGRSYLEAIRVEVASYFNRCRRKQN